MKGIKTIRPSRCETDPDVLAAHLSQVLLGCRNRKTARDLVGNDERSDEFGVDDIDLFADALCAGMNLTADDRARVRTRARKLADARVRTGRANVTGAAGCGRGRDHG